MPITQDRITIVLSLTHQHVGEDPLGVQIIAQELLNSEEQPYQRRFQCAGVWRPLDLGWLEADKVGLVLLENQEGKGLQVNPTEEEKREIAERIVEVSFTENPEECELVPPGRFYLGSPSDISRLKIRCQHASAQCKLTLFPK